LFNEETKEYEEYKKRQKEKNNNESKENSASDIKRNIYGNTEYEKLFKKYEQIQNHKFISSNLRNVLFVGKSRSGKTTAIETLKSVGNPAGEFLIFSQTPTVKFRAFSLQSSSTVNYTLNIIDTPGLFEIKIASDKVRQNKEIIKLISDMLKNEIVKIHAVVICCAISDGINLTDIEAMKMLIKFFGEKTNLAICFTKSENKDKNYRIGVREQLEQHEDMKEIMKKVNNQILYIGACEPLAVDNALTLENQLQRLITDRDKMLKFIFESTKPINIMDLEYMQNQTKILEVTLNEIFQKLENLDVDKKDHEFLLEINKIKEEN